MIPKQNLSFGKKRSFGIVPKVPHEIINIRNHRSRAKRKFLPPLIIQLLDQLLVTKKNTTDTQDHKAVDPTGRSSNF